MRRLLPPLLAEPPLTWAFTESHSGECPTGVSAAVENWPLVAGLVSDRVSTFGRW